MATPEEEKKVEKKAGAHKRKKPQTTNTRVVVRFRPINKIEKAQWKKDILKNCIKEAQLEAVSSKLTSVPEMKDPKNWPKYAEEKWDNWLKDKCEMQPGHLRLFKRFCREFDFSRLDKNSMKDVVPVEVYEDQRQIQIFIPEQGETKAFAFDEVMWWQRDQIYCFKTIAQPVMEDALQGFNATIFAYGQSGSGKTFTLFGPEPLDKAPPELLGVIPSSLAWIFKVLEGDETNKFFEVKLSFLEVYLERLRDLMNPFDSQGKDKKLKIMELAGGKAALDALRGKQAKQAKVSAKNRRGARAGRGRKEPAKKKAPIEVVIDNLSEQRVDNIAQVQALIATAAHHRTKEKTNLNASSSRSHLIMTVRVSITKKSGTVIKSKINFADLAGSEKVGKTDVTGKHLKEAAAINTSLTALRTVIDGLVKQKKFVSFRDSKLTRALRDSLGGNTKTTLVLGCSPHKWNLEETLETLKFGARAKFIRSKVIVNAQASVEQLEKVIDGLKKENDRLRKKLQIEHAKQGIRRLETHDSTESIQKDGAEPEHITPRPSPTKRSSIVLAVLKQERGLTNTAKLEAGANRSTADVKHMRRNSKDPVSALESHQQSVKNELALQAAKEENRDLQKRLQDAKEREDKVSARARELMEQLTSLEEERQMHMVQDEQEKRFIEETTFHVDGQLLRMQRELEAKDRQLAEKLLELENYKMSNSEAASDIDRLMLQDRYSEQDKIVQEQVIELNNRVNDLLPDEVRHHESLERPSMKFEDFKDFKEEELFLMDSKKIITPQLDLPIQVSTGVTTSEVEDDIMEVANRGEMDVGRIETVFMVLQKIAKIDNKDEIITLNQLMEFFVYGNLDIQTCMRIYTYLPEEKCTVDIIRQTVKSMKLSLELRDIANSFKLELMKVTDDYAVLVDDLPPTEEVIDVDNVWYITLEDINKLNLGEMNNLIYTEAFTYIKSRKNEEILSIDFQLFIDHLTGRGQILGMSDGTDFQDEMEDMEFSGFREELIEPVSKIFERDGNTNLSMEGAKLVLQEIRESTEDIEESDPGLHILYDLSLINLESVIRCCPDPMWHTLIEKPEDFDYYDDND